MRMTRRNVLIAAIVGIVAILLITWVIVRTKGPGQNARAASDGAAQPPSVTVTKVVSQDLNRELRLPGELQAYQDVALYAKVPGFVEWIVVGATLGAVYKPAQAAVGRVTGV